MRLNGVGLWEAHADPFRLNNRSLYPAYFCIVLSAEVCSMLRITSILAVCFLSQPLFAAPVPVPTQKERERAFAVIAKFGGTVVLQRGRQRIGVYRVPLGTGRVIDISLATRPITDETLRAVSRFPEARSLYFYGDKLLTNAGMNHLSAMHRLQGLDIGRANITDEGLRCLRAMPDLEQLTISSTNISGAGLNYLSANTHLYLLSLINCREIKDGNLRYIKGLSGLRQLSLFAATSITDSGLVYLERLTKLEALDLSFSKITSA